MANKCALDACQDRRSRIITSMKEAGLPACLQVRPPTPLATRHPRSLATVPMPTPMTIGNVAAKKARQCVRVEVVLATPAVEPVSMMPKPPRYRLGKTLGFQVRGPMMTRQPSSVSYANAAVRFVSIQFGAARRIATDAISAQDVLVELSLLRLPLRLPHRLPLHSLNRLQARRASASQRRGGA